MRRRGFRSLRHHGGCYCRHTHDRRHRIQRRDEFRTGRGFFTRRDSAHLIAQGGNRARYQLTRRRLRRRVAFHCSLQQPFQTGADAAHHGESAGAGNAGERMRGAQKILIHLGAGLHLAAVNTQCASKRLRLGQENVVELSADADVADMHGVIGRDGFRRRRNGTPGDETLRRKIGLACRRQRLYRADFFRPLDQLRRVYAGLFLRAQLRNPPGKFSVREFDQAIQIRRAGFFLGAQFIEHLLHFPTRVAKVLEPDHAPAALEGMEGAAQCSQKFLIPRLVTAFGQRGGNGGKHLARLFEEYFQHFRIRVAAAVDVGCRCGNRRHGSSRCNGDDRFHRCGYGYDRRRRDLGCHHGPRCRQSDARHHVRQIGGALPCFIDKGRQHGQTPGEQLLRLRIARFAIRITCDVTAPLQGQCGGIRMPHHGQRTRRLCQ